MNAQQRKTLDKFSRAIVFVETNPPVLASASPGFTRQVQALKTAIASIDRVAPDRGSGVPAKTANQRALLRRALQVNQLYPIRRVARVLGRTIGGMPHLVNIPNRLSSTQVLLDAAKAVVRDVAPYKAQFVDGGLSTDFLDRVSATIEALEAVRQTNTTARLAAAGARGQLVKSLQDGRDALTLLDGAIRDLCHASPALGAATLAVWNTIVVPRGRANRSVSDVLSGTAADVAGGNTGGGG
jgi:hypothetical protein